MVWYVAARPLARRVARRMGASLAGIRVSTGDQLGKRRGPTARRGVTTGRFMCGAIDGGSVVWNWEQQQKRVPEILVCVTLR